MSKIITALRQTHDLVVIDSTSLLQDATLACFDQSDVIMTVLTLEITNIKNIRQFLALADQLGYAEDKVQLVLNRADSGYGIRLQDVESSVGRKVQHSVVSDGRTVVFALNRGVPFVVASRQTRVSEDIVQMVKSVLGDEQAEHEEMALRPPPKKSLFQWRAH